MLIKSALVPLLLHRSSLHQRSSLMKLPKSQRICSKSLKRTEAVFPNLIQLTQENQQLNGDRSENIIW
jgi:hypothetical protein